MLTYGARCEVECEQKWSTWHSRRLPLRTAPLSYIQDTNTAGTTVVMPHQATTHHAFVLQHHITRYKAAHKKLYCCFIDFAKAYDSQSRTNCGNACMTWVFVVRSCMLSNHCMM
jgi:hypothetical protein